VEALVNARDGEFIIRFISTTVSVNIKMYLVKSLDWPFNSKHDKNLCLKAEDEGGFAEKTSGGDFSTVNSKIQFKFLVNSKASIELFNLNGDKVR
jgi:hypothetical protein